MWKVSHLLCSTDFTQFKLVLVVRLRDSTTRNAGEMEEPYLSVLVLLERNLEGRINPHT